MQVVRRFDRLRRQARVGRFVLAVGGMALLAAGPVGCGPTALPKGYGAAGREPLSVLPASDATLERIDKITPQDEAVARVMAEPIEKVVPAALRESKVPAEADLYRRLKDVWGTFPFADLKERKTYLYALKVATTAGSLDVLLEPRATPDLVRHLLALCKVGHFNGKAVRFEGGWLLVGGTRAKADPPAPYTLPSRPLPNPMPRYGVALFSAVNDPQRAEPFRLAVAVGPGSENPGRGLTPLGGVIGLPKEAVAALQEKAGKPGGITVTGIQIERTAIPLFNHDGTKNLPKLGRDGKPMFAAMQGVYDDRPEAAGKGGGPVAPSPAPPAPPPVPGKSGR